MVRRQLRRRQLSLGQQEHFRGFYSDFLKVKRLLAVLGAPRGARQWGHLFRSVSNRNRLVQLFQVVFGRLDFFLVRSNLAATAGQSRQWLAHRQVFVNGAPVTSSTSKICVGDCVRLVPSVARRYRGRARLRLFCTAQFRRTTQQLLRKGRYASLLARPLRPSQGLHLGPQLLCEWLKVSRRRRYLGRSVVGSRYCGLRDKSLLALRPRTHSGTASSLYRRRLGRRHLVNRHVPRYRRRPDTQVHPCQHWQSVRYPTFLRYHFQSFGVTVVGSPSAPLLVQPSSLSLTDLQQLPFTL